MDYPLKNGTGLKNKKSGQLACIHGHFLHNGEDTKWELVNCYHVSIINKNRYLYINQDVLIKNWDILTDSEYTELFKQVWEAKK